MAYRRRYPTDLSDAEWEQVEPLVPPVKQGGRPALHQRREIIDALAYWLRAGCAWRLLPGAVQQFEPGVLPRSDMPQRWQPAPVLGFGTKRQIRAEI